MIKNFVLATVIFLLSGAILYVTVNQLDPLGEQRLVALIAFFLSVFCGGASFLTFVFFFGAELFSGRRLGARQFLVAVRRAVLVALFLVIVLLLQLFRFAGVLEIVLLATFLALVEWIFVTGKK